LGKTTLMTTMSFSLPDEMKAFVETEMAQEGYASASEYLRALIRDAQKRRAKLELEAKLLIRDEINCTCDATACVRSYLGRQHTGGQRFL
jgi:Arc/MetJ-type ribon-helix-helix transcriptional regulator